MAFAVRQFKNGLSSCFELEEMRQTREGVRAAFWDLRKGATAIRQIEAVCLNLISESMEEIGEYPALHNWIVQERAGWHQLKQFVLGNNDTDIKTALNALQDALDSEKMLIQQAKRLI